MLKKEDGRIELVAYRAGNFQSHPRFRAVARSVHLLPGAELPDMGRAGVQWVEGTWARMGLRAANSGLCLFSAMKLMVRCGGTTHLRILAVKLEGRKRVSGAEFVNGARLLSGERFGQA